MKLWEFGAGKTWVQLQNFLNELMEENLKQRAERWEAQTWKEYTIKSYWKKKIGSVKAERKLKDRQTSVPSPRGMEG